MSRFVLDTSVAVAWYLPEDFSPEAREWQDRLLRGELGLVVPPLHYWEFANVLRTYVRRGEIEDSLALETYQLHLGAPLEVVSPAPESVLEVALDHGATAYDAVYVELASSLEIPLLTAERSTTPWVSRLGTRAVCVRG